MRTTNTKVNRTFEALAVALSALPDKTIDRIHALINDEQDGYIFDFRLAVDLFRRLTKS